MFGCTEVYKIGIAIKSGDGFARMFAREDDVIIWIDERPEHQIRRNFSSAVPGKTVAFNMTISRGIGPIDRRDVGNSSTGDRPHTLGSIWTPPPQVTPLECSRGRFILSSTSTNRFQIFGPDELFGSAAVTLKPRRLVTIRSCNQITVRDPVVV